MRLPFQSALPARRLALLVAATVAVVTATAGGTAVAGGRVAPAKAPPRGPAVFAFSELPVTWSANGWGPVERNRSNGEVPRGDGRVLRLGGRTFATGLGTHAPSELRYRVPATCTRFSAVVGIDDEVSFGSVRFSVQLDGRTVYRSGVRRASSPNAVVSVPVRPGATLRLLVDDAGDGASGDHADWADARLTCARRPSTAPVRAAPAPRAPVVPGRDFSASTALWSPIGASPRLDARSAAINSRLAEPGASRVTLLYEFGNKIYQADASTPRYTLNVLHAGVDKWGDNDLRHETVPIPDGAVPGEGSDGKLVIVDTSRRKVYDLWQVKRNGATWDVSWGGVYDLDGDGSSHNASYGNGQYSVPWPQPVSRGTGSGMSTLAGTVKMSEIKAGVISHALVFATDIACGPAQSGEFRWPATTTDGWRTSGTCIPQGARIQLDPSIDLTKVPGITKAELAIGRALQTYGAYATDNGGSRISIGFEAPKAGDENPYPAAGLAHDYWGLDRLPWHSVRVLDSWNGE